MVQSLTGVVCCALLLAAVGPAGAAVLRVPSDYPTIQAGVDAAVLGDTVLVAPGTYQGAGNTRIDFHGTDLKLLSDAGAAMTVIDCADTARAFKINSGETSAAHIRGFTVWRAWSYVPGGGVYVSDSSPTIEDCVFEGCSTTGLGPGAAMHLRRSSPTITRCAFIKNTARNGGCGISIVNSSPIVTDCLFDGNDGQDFCSAIWCVSGDPVFSGCTFVNQRSDRPNLPVIVTRMSSLVLERCIIAHNTDAVAIHDQGLTSFVVECSNIYGNGGGNWTGAVADFLGVNGNIEEDPLFCDAANPEVPRGLHANSPCAPGNSGGCGLIGALDVACGVSPVREATWGVIKAMYR